MFNYELIYKNDFYTVTCLGHQGFKARILTLIGG
jgi:hypothetical protein